MCAKGRTFRIRMYDFDEIIDRRGTGTEKYAELELMFGTNDEEILPLWVADMDFRTPDFVRDAIRKRLEHPILSYTVIPDNYFKPNGFVFGPTEDKEGKVRGTRLALMISE